MVNKIDQFKEKLFFKANIVLLVLLLLNTAAFSQTIISRNKTVTASKTHSTTKASNIVDGNSATAWNAGAYKPQWVIINLQGNFSVSKIVLLPSISPKGNTSQDIYISSDMVNWKKADSFTVLTAEKTSIVRTYSPQLEGVKGVKVLTTNSPSWISWYEIEVYGSSNSTENQIVANNSTSNTSLNEYETFCKDAYNGNLAQVKTYVENKKSLDPIAGTDVPFNALSLAVMNNKYEIFAYLLANGANPNSLNPDNSTVINILFIHYRNINNQLGYLNLLLNYKANVNIIDDEGLSTIDYAATTKNPFIVTKLIEEGAAVTNNFSIDLDGDQLKYSSLTWLLANICDLELTKLYVLKGADVNSTCSVNGSVLSALDFAQAAASNNTNYTPIVDYLKSKSAKNYFTQSGTNWVSIKSIISGLTTSNTVSKNSATCYSILNSSYKTSVCGYDLTGYKIHCNDKNQDVLLIYYPTTGSGDCFFKKNEGWYSHGTGVTDTQWYIVTYKKSFEEAANEFCNCD